MKYFLSMYFSNLLYLWGNRKILSPLIFSSKFSEFDILIDKEEMSLTDQYLCFFEYFFVALQMKRKKISEENTLNKENLSDLITLKS